MASVISENSELEYEICRHSSSAGPLVHDNQAVGSTNQISPPQCLVLKLKRPAVVKAIKLNKYEKSSTCHLKIFRICGGLDENNMIVLLDGISSNDSVPEIHDLRYKNEKGQEFPISYLKIMPLLAYDIKLMLSIWHIQLYGQDDPVYLAASLKNYNMSRETETVKLCLKHFRQIGYKDAFEALQRETNVSLEYTAVTDLHCCLVNEGNFYKAEALTEKYINEGLMDDYLMEQKYRHTWKLQETKSTERPGNRGGHQLVVDTERHSIYLYGGWDGLTDLSDLWRFDIETCTWTLLDECSELHGGPTPRSCHKMVFDSMTGKIFTLGRYLVNSVRSVEYIKSDFFSFDTRENKWLKICDDTSQVGGPNLIYDHQMCIDVTKRTIYVFGGKILTPRRVNQVSCSASEYSGLFSYHITTNIWRHILVDSDHPSASRIKLTIKSRVTHCMVFHNKYRKLYIYGGQRGKEDIDEFISYDVDNHCISFLNIDRRNLNNNNSIFNTNDNNSNSIHRKEPPAGFTQRATIDCDRDEIYIFSSLTKQKDKRGTQKVESSSNSFWVFSLKKSQWTQVYQSKNRYSDFYSLGYEKPTMQSEPCPRYAHQLIYDDVKKVHYLFGGNPGKVTLPQLRLDDFWILSLEKPKRQEILRHCQYLIRQMHYEELTNIKPLEAMNYLQTSVSEIIDHTDSQQVKKFHKLAFLLFKTEENDNSNRPSSPSFDAQKHPLQPIDSSSEDESLVEEDDDVINIDDDDDNEVIVIDDDDDDDDHNNDGDDEDDGDDDSNLNNYNAGNKDITIHKKTLETVFNFNDIIDKKFSLRSELDIIAEMCSKTASTATATATNEKTETDNQLPLYDGVLYNLYKNCGGKKTIEEFYCDLKTNRTYLFNKIVQFMPSNMVQPKKDLRDFVNF